MSDQTGGLVRRAVWLRGVVQGVGLRPAIYRLATAHELSGFVHNARDGVRLEVEGAVDAVSGFLARLGQEGGDMADIETFDVVELAPSGARGFAVRGSEASVDARLFTWPGLIPPDLAPCEACLRDLEDPLDRRYRYPFLSCTACGPRLSVVRALPYERERTTLAAFPLCAACRREYEDPRDRRFHAQAIACPACGPTLSLVEGGARTQRGDDALRAAARLLTDGAIVALKGAAGFALACDATNEGAVALLRQRKLRPHKPFAVLARDLTEAERVARLSDVDRDILRSRARPILLVPARPGGPLAPSVAPRLTDVGVFLAPTPLQQLLLQDGPALQVLTSGNASDEPLAKDDEEALARLGDVADAVLLHDRHIVRRADDSVLRAMDGGAVALRRARGVVPRTLALPVRGPCVLGVGAEHKATLCLARGGEALLSAHLGNLRQPDVYALYRRTADELLRACDEEPVALAHDLHPDYRSTRFALERGLRAIGVQHHHAHIASCLVEHGRTEPVLGLVFDGTGYGDDGSLWGGEALIADLVGYRRVAHLRPLELLGGERAIREPWRLALSALCDAGESVAPLRELVDVRRLERAAAWLRQGVPAPRASGAGRWFDAVAALCGLRAEVSYDGQAAAELEALAGEQPAMSYPLSLEPGAPGAPSVVDLRPAVREIAAARRADVAVSVIAARFHETLARAAAGMALHARAAGGPDVVALTGGCFQNRRLLQRTRRLLEESGFEVLRHRALPPNDGGVALGQAAVAAARLTREGEASCA